MEKLINKGFFSSICILQIFLFVSSNLLFAEESVQYPADVSFLVVDLKYSKEHGVKICEVQQGILSAFFGDRFVNDGRAVIAENFLSFISQYFDKSWAINGKVGDSEVLTLMKQSPFWVLKSDIKKITSDSTFKKCARRDVADPKCLSSYHGFLYLSPTRLSEIKNFKEKYPGIVVMDLATHPFWIDKYHMSELFDQDEVLVTFKPKWNLYPKKYTAALSNKIISDIGGDYFVIKPRGAFKGNGVIIVYSSEFK